jgi:hypothetical protein
MSRNPNGQSGDAGKASDPLIQFEMANDIIRALLIDKLPSLCLRFLPTLSILILPSLEEDKRILCQMLGKLYIPDEVDVDKIRTLKLLIDNVSSVNTASLLMSFIEPEGRDSADHLMIPLRTTRLESLRRPYKRSSKKNWRASVKLNIESLRSFRNSSTFWMISCPKTTQKQSTPR